MKFKMLLTLAVLTSASLTASAQYTANSFFCGRATNPLIQCNGIPISLGSLPVGTAWLHDYLTGTGPSYILWEGDLSQMPEALIGKTVCTSYKSYIHGTLVSKECVSLATYFHGGSFADQSYYTGEGTFHFYYYYGGYGIYAGWRRVLLGGAITISNY